MDLLLNLTSFPKPYCVDTGYLGILSDVFDVSSVSEPGLWHFQRICENVRQLSDKLQIACKFWKKRLMAGCRLSNLK